MIIKIEENIKSFSSWANMVKANAEKIKGFGATIIFAFPEGYTISFPVPV